MDSYFIGLDPGLLQDYTALVIAQRFNMPYSIELDKCPGIYHIVHLQRFELGTYYVDIAEEVASLLAKNPLKNHYRLVVDYTGVGGAVVELLRERGLKPVSVTITHGSEVSREKGSIHVPKRDLIITLQVLLQSDRLKIAEDLNEADKLVKELIAYRVKITPAGNDIYGPVREKDHDDLILGAALACWYGERVGGIMTGRPVSGHDRRSYVRPPEIRWPGIY